MIKLGKTDKVKSRTIILSKIQSTINKLNKSLILNINELYNRLKLTTYYLLWKTTQTTTVKTTFLWQVK